jgi:hypothetical protein
LIYELINDSPGPYFLARPRRFGKTLLIDTILKIFQGRKDLFQDLDIVQKRLMEDWEPFPVIQLSFNAYPLDPAGLKDRLIFEMNEIVSTCSLELGAVRDIADISKIIVRMSNLETIRRKKAGITCNTGDPSNIVILIDEYDYPLLHNIDDNVKLSEIRQILSAFYGAINPCFKNLRFSLITGITKFDLLSLFSSMTNVKDISLLDKYSTICGFTEDDVRTYYRDHLDATLNHLKKTTFFEPDYTVDILVAELMKWYDGYSWDGKKRVLNPLSVSSFFTKRAFGKFWYASGPPIFTSLLTLKDESYFKIFSKNYQYGHCSSLRV